MVIIITLLPERYLLCNTHTWVITASYLKSDLFQRWNVTICWLCLTPSGQTKQWLAAEGRRVPPNLLITQNGFTVSSAPCLISVWLLPRFALLSRASLWSFLWFNCLIMLFVSSVLRICTRQAQVTAAGQPKPPHTVVSHEQEIKYICYVTNITVWSYICLKQ